jgi:predicted lipoprotein
MPREEGFPMKSLVLPIMAALALSVVACRQEGAAERAGAKIDEAIEDTREAGEEALEDAGEALEDAGEAVEETAEEAAEKARKAVE